MSDTHELDLSELERSLGYLVVKHGVGVDGAYGSNLLSKAHEHVDLGTLTFVEKFRHRDDNSWVSLFQRTDTKASVRSGAFMDNADRRVLL